MSGIMAAACCCGGGGPPTTCPEWTLCRPQEIQITYSYTANFKQVIVPQAGATGLGGVLVNQTESCFGTIALLRSSGAVQGCGGLLFNPMVDFRGNYSYNKTLVTNRFFDPNTDAALCPSLCTLCTEIVPSQRSVTTNSVSWDNTSNPSLHGANGIVQCFRCLTPSATYGNPQGLLTAYQRGNFSVAITNYRCNGTTQSTSSNVLNNHYAPLDVYSKPQCLTATAFDDYHVTRDQLACLLPALQVVGPISYPYCATPTPICNTSGVVVYRESESLTDCYQLGCTNRGCFNPSLFYGCGCDLLPSCPNPFPPSGSNSCYEEHLEYTMTSSVVVDYVIP